MNKKTSDLSKYMEAIAKSYSEQLSESIKRGIKAAKERKQKNENR